MTLELNQEQAMLVLQALDRLSISKYAYPEEYRVANMLMAKIAQRVANNGARARGRHKDQKINGRLW